MARSRNLSTYPIGERALLSDAFIAKLPQPYGPFPTHRAAMSARLRFYGLIGAARKSGNPHEEINSYRLAITTPTAHTPNSATAGGLATTTPSPPTWWLYLYNRDDPTNTIGDSACNANIATLLQQTLGTADAIAAAAASFAGSPTTTTTGVSAGAPAIDNAKLEDLLQQIGYAPNN